MGKPGKNKGTQRGAIKATITGLKETYKNFAARVVEEQTSLRKEVAGSFLDLQERFKKIVVATGQQLAQLNANQQVHGDVIEQLDINVQAVAKMHLEAFGRFEQIEVFMTMLGQLDDLTQEQLAEVKEKAKESYEATMTECFRQVREERAAAVEEQRKAADEAKKADAAKVQEAEVAKKKALDDSEQDFAESALQEAEAPNLSTTIGGQGSGIPAGADVFGGQ
jgi:hypothetical protein